MNLILNTKLIGVGVLIGLSIVVVIFGALKFNLLELPIAEEEPLFDVEAWNNVTSYNGIDGQGQTILDIIKSINDETYSDPNILLNGTAFVEWRSFKEPTLGNDVYQVDFFIDTAIETRNYIWHVDKITWEISSGNEAAQELLDQVNLN